MAYIKQLFSKIQKSFKSVEPSFDGKALQNELEELEAKESDIKVKFALAKLAGNFKFSDQTGHKKLYDIETQIAEKVMLLKNSSDPLPIISEVETLLNIRNKKLRR